MDILRFYIGQVTDRLAITSVDTTTNLDFPDKTVSCCPELMHELQAIVGKDNLKLE